MNSNLLLAIVLGLVLAAGGVRAQDGAHGHGHAENHGWYRGLTSNQGFSCCNALTADGDGDCRPASVWRDESNRVWARIGGRTVLVPPSAVLPDGMNKKPLTGHACEKNGLWYCALVGGAGG